TANDNCDADVTVTYEGEIRTDGACGDSYTLTRTWKAIDNCGNETTASQIITVQDVTAPVLTVPANVTVECSAVPAVGVATATDNCDADVTITFEGEVKTNGSCSGSYILTRTWRAIDNCGNEDTAQQTIRVIDTTPPYISVQASDLTVECDGQGNKSALNQWLNSNGGAIAEDLCGKVTWRKDYHGLSDLCGATGSATVKFSAFDDCGNVATTSATFTIVDTTPPSIDCPESIVVNNDPGSCGTNISIPQPSYQENCGSATLRNNINASADASGYYQTGVTTIIWTITDDCGNSSSCSMTVTVIDNETPVITCPPDLQLCVNEPVNPGVADATDNCGILAVTSNAPATFPAGVTVITWTATDINGLTATCEQTITIVSSATAFAGDDIAVCAADSIYLASAAAANYSQINWTTSGTGMFNDPGLLHPTYYPSQQDAASGKVTLYLNTTGTAPCGNAVDSLDINFIQGPSIEAGSNAQICYGYSYTINDAVAVNYGSLIWTINPANAGTLSDPASLHPTFTPAAGFTGTVSLRLLASGTSYCTSQIVTDDIQLTVFQELVADAGADQTITAGNSVTLHGTATGGTSFYTWQWQPADLLTDPAVAAPTTLPLEESVLFTLNVLDLASGCTATDDVLVVAGTRIFAPVAIVDYDTTDPGTPVTVRILENDTIQTVAGIAVTLCAEPQNGIVIVNPDKTITYTPNPRFSGNDVFCYMICDDHNPPMCDTALVKIYVKSDGISILDPTSGITPNSDGRNDYWIIRGILDYPDNEVWIFNRWGDEIVRYQGYDNKSRAWDGRYTSNQPVPDGTYYYIIKVKEVGTLAGWIFVRSSE
ncbi:MAG TPA: gliding motility-associated C-terminal domain-containing protein, partial [Bacteroidales bacterium]|nr:gliding motility-associated C-terminal domain-containing protein [Bacteroidales bacterium]